MSVTRVALAYCALGALLVGLPAMFAPQTFYEDFPFIASWVDNIPPYNSHLTTDTGGLYLGFALLLGWAMVRAALVVPVCVAFAATQALHLGYHLTHLDGYTTEDAVTQSVALAGFVVMPLVAIAARAR